MRWIGVIDDDGQVTEEGTCPDHCDVVTALGRQLERGERYIDGKGKTAAEAQENSRYTYPNEIL